MNKLTVECFMFFLLGTLLISSCKKEAVIRNENKPTLDTVILTTYNWLIVPAATTSYALNYREPDYFIDKVITRDTSRLIFYTHGNYSEEHFAKEEWIPSTVPWVPDGIPPPGDYLPHGSSSYYGTFTLSLADSVVNRHFTIQGISFDSKRKILVLTKDSLRLALYPLPADTTYAFTTYFASPK